MRSHCSRTLSRLAPSIEAMELSEILDSPRDVVAHYHLEAGRAWRLQGAPKRQNSHLVYAALEFRCAIERYVLQMYLMMDPEAEHAPERFRDFTSLVKIVHAEAGDRRKLWRVLTFNAVYGRVVFGLPFNIAEPRVGRGIIVRSPTIAQGFLGGLKSIIGGNIGSYTEMCEQARQQSFDLLIQHAMQMGANAFVLPRV